MEPIVLIIWVACGCAAAAIANGKGRSPFVWGFVGFTFGLIGLLVTACMSDLTKQTNVTVEPAE